MTERQVTPGIEGNRRRMNRADGGTTPDAAYRSLCRLGGVAAWMVALLTVVEVIAFTVFPPPDTVRDWFTLFQGSPIVGFIGFWGLELPMYLMFVMVFLALYVVLKKNSESGMAIALALALLGVAIFFATNNPFTMLTLSRRYAAAATEGHRAALVAAGEAILASTNQRAVGGFNIALFLVSVGGLIVSSVMLRSRSFSRTTAYVGILAHGLSLADYLRQALTTSTAIALFVILPGALLLVIWFVWVGTRLLWLGQSEREIPPGQA